MQGGCVSVIVTVSQKLSERSVAVQMQDGCATMSWELSECSVAVQQLRMSASIFPLGLMLLFFFHSELCRGES
jgi:hypothetical protein